MSDADLTWTIGTVKSKTPKGDTVTLPAQRGLSADGLTAVEMVGSKEQIVSASVVGLLSSTNEAATRRSAAYAAFLLQKLIPEWKASSDWLAAQMRQLRQRSTIETRMHGWKIRLTFLAKANQLTLQITR